MVGWHHHLSGNEFERTPADSEGQGSLACRSPWGCKESDTTTGQQMTSYIISMLYLSELINPYLFFITN